MTTRLLCVLSALAFCTSLPADQKPEVVTASEVAAITRPDTAQGITRATAYYRPLAKSATALLQSDVAV
jgi:hypothetical protein